MDADTTAATASSPPSDAPTVLRREDQWLRDFYKECGREITLAYTTLNQMKNWAIIVQASILAAVVSLNRPVQAGTAPGVTTLVSMPVLIGAILAYLFTIRFFVRAMLCYGNLLRWNALQRQLVRTFVVSPLEPPSDELKKTQSKIDKLFLKWGSPTSRLKLIAANLQLGFGLLLVLPTALLTWNAWAHRRDPIAMGLMAFAAGATVLELVDIRYSRFFDTDPPEQGQGGDEEGSGLWRRIWPWLLAIGVAAATASLWPWRK